MDIQFIEKIERELEEELPGQEAQFLMAPPARKLVLEIPDNYVEACVLLLIFPQNKEWHITLIERVSDNPNDHHAGQLSFPGGCLEETDYSHQDCALREAEEEIGINAGDIGILGELTSIYIPVSNFLIYPFIGFMSDVPSFTPQKSEVSNVISIPLKEFMDPKNKKIKNINVKDYTLYDVPYYDIHEIPLWGATAMIMSEFETILKKLIK